MLPLELNLGPLLPEHPEEILVGIVLFLIILVLTVLEFVILEKKVFYR